MPLEVANRPLRDALELKSLVEAVLAANDEDETFFLEWKSSLDLQKKDDIFAIARCILGMANRQPDLAATRMGGLGYMVIGAAGGTSDGKAAGIARMDEVDLANKLSSYLGNEHPTWSSSWTQVDGSDILVITIEPPRWGDLIWLLWADYQDARNRLVAQGTVFTRDGTKTKPVNAAQHRMLQDRLRRSPAQEPSLNIQVEVSSEELATFAWDDASVDEWLAVLRGSLNAMEAPTGTSDEDIRSGNFRMSEEYVEEVSRYMWSVSQQVRDVGASRVMAGETGATNGLMIALENPGAGTLRDVEMAIRIPAQALIGVYYFGQALWESLPSTPKPPQRGPYGMTIPDFSSPYIQTEPIGPINPKVIVDERNPAGDVTVRVRFDDLRGLGRVFSPTIHVLPAPSMVSSELQCHYTLTSVTVDAVQQGAFALQVGSDVVQFNRAVPIQEVLANII